MQPVTRQRPVDLAGAALRQAILAGRPPAGQLLPPERTLAVTLGVSRLTLRAALARLEAEGLVRARQGDGVRVLDVQTHGRLDLLAHLDVAGDARLLRGLLELRRAVAADAVGHACARATAADRAALAALAAAQASEADARRYAERDVEFSRRLLACADNLAAILVFNSLADAMASHPELAALLHTNRATSLAGYAVVLAALAAGDGARGRELVRAALEHADADVLRRASRGRRARAARRSR